MAENERLEVVADAVVRALRQVVWGLQITQDELHAAGAFLDRVGAAGCMRSLLDTCFAMTAVDRERDGVPGTRPNLEGPEYLPGAPERQGGSLFEREPGPDADRLTLTGVVTNAETGEPVAGAEIDVWQTDEHGRYDRSGSHMRGIVRSGDDGRYRIETLLPVDYTAHETDPIGELLGMLGRHCYRAAHIHLKVRVDGEERLTTQLFRSDSPHLDSDYVRGAVSDDLVMAFRPAAESNGFEATFDLAVSRPTGAARTEG